jgi:hypothetical protein
VDIIRNLIEERLAQSTRSNTSNWVYKQTQMLTILIDEIAVMSIQSIFRLADYGLREGKHMSYVSYSAAHNMIGGNSY